MPNNKIYFVLISLSLSIFNSAIVKAETEADADTEHSTEHSDVEEVLVTATPMMRSQFDIVQSTARISGDELVAELGGNIGETLEHIPGISNSFFGPGAGRPIVRGLGGDRVRVLVGGIGSIDASSTSPDHAVAGDPLTTQTIEIIRGPATLLYGNNALGGVINLMDGRIPDEPLDKPIAGAFRTIFASNADEVNISGAIDVKAGEKIVLHFEGSNRDANNMTIPDFARSAALRISDPLIDPTGEVQNSVPNSNLNNSNYSAGGSLFFDSGFIGLSVGKLKNNYGIPVVFEEGGEDVRINLDQTRVDVMGEWDKGFLFFDRAKLRFGWADYEHKELEGPEVGTVFLNKGWEGRIELVQQTLELNNAWMMDGAMGVQLKKRNFEAIGDEAFVPPSSTTQFGLFIMEEWGNNATSLQLGSRIEFQDVSAPSIGMDKSFTGVSISGGISHLINHEILIGFTAHRTERNPNAEELFSNGPHIATQTFELGNENLFKERATGGEITIRKRDGNLTGSLTFFVNSFDNFIFENFTDETIDGLPVARFEQTDASFYGGEAELNWQAWSNQTYNLSFDLGADFVRAKEKINNRPLPRIPPYSLTLATELESALYSLRFEGEWADEQTRTDIGETSTDSYFRLDSSLTIHPFAEERQVSFILQVRNITNEEIRHHTSFLKDLLPAQGRDLRLSLRVGF